MQSHTGGGQGGRPRGGGQGGERVRRKLQRHAFQSLGRAEAGLFTQPLYTGDAVALRKVGPVFVLGMSVLKCSCANNARICTCPVNGCVAQNFGLDRLEVGPAGKKKKLWVHSRT